MRKHAEVYRTTTARQARTLAASLTALLVGAALYAQNVRAQERVAGPVFAHAALDATGAPA